MATVTVKDKQITFKEVEVEFPLYVLSGYNHRKTTDFEDEVETETHYEMTKIISPYESFRLQKVTQSMGDGTCNVCFEMNFVVRKDKPDNAEYYLIGEDCYNKPATKQQWDLLHMEFQAFLNGFYTPIEGLKTWELLNQIK